MSGFRRFFCSFVPSEPPLLYVCCTISRCVVVVFVPSSLSSPQFNLEALLFLPFLWLLARFRVRLARPHITLARIRVIRRSPRTRNDVPKLPDRPIIDVADSGSQIWEKLLDFLQPRYPAPDLKESEWALQAGLGMKLGSRELDVNTEQDGNVTSVHPEWAAYIVRGVNNRCK